MALQAQKIRAAIQPPVPIRDRLQIYMMTPGATPKLTRSAKESSCAPKRVSAPNMRAARPSSMSKIMASTTQATAVCQSAVRAKRMAVAPLQSPSKVRVDGTSLLMERSSSRSSLAATIWRARALRAPFSRLAGGVGLCSLSLILELRQYGFSRPDFLIGLGEDLTARR